MGSLFNNSSLIQYKYNVTIYDSGKTMGDYYAGPSLAEPVEGALDQSLAFSVQTAGSLIEDKNRRILEEYPGN